MRLRPDLLARTNNQPREASQFQHEGKEETMDRRVAMNLWTILLIRRSNSERPKCGKALFAPSRYLRRSSLFGAIPIRAREIMPTEYWSEMRSYSRNARSYSRRALS